MQKIQVTVPRIIYVISSKELREFSVKGGRMKVKKVDRHLPHHKSANFLYKLTLSEHFYQSNKWVDMLQPNEKVGFADRNTTSTAADTLYETLHPLILCALSNLGCMIRTNKSLEDAKG